MGETGPDPEKTEGEVGRTVGRYVLYDEIAAGGMAAVHFGKLSGPVGFSRPVAIKRLHPHLAKDPDFVTMFLDEARLAARVRHPNVVPTLDVVAMETEVFIVMEYVQGESVSRLVRAQQRRGTPMPIPNALAIVAGALHGLHAAHEARDEQGEPLNLVHRDVSPQNILVGADGGVRVLDFGVAKAAGRLANTRDGALKGKVAYMSPEQIAGHEVTRRSDIYSACVVLWELLAGRRLYEADTEIELVSKVLGRIAEPNIDLPSKHNPRVSAELDDIVRRGLAPLPEDRFPTARELAQLLERKGGLVAASELGDWVESLASEVLSRRAARVHAIESGSSSSNIAALALAAGVAASVPPSAVSSSRKFATDAETVVSEPSTAAGLSVARHHDVKSRKRRVALGIAVAAFFVVGLLAVVGLRSIFGGAPATGGGVAAKASEEPSTTPIASAVPPASAPASLEAADASTAAIAAPVVTPTPSAARSAPTAPRVAAPIPNRPPFVTVRPKSEECDPPYTIDGEGHKVYKRNCLK